MYNIPGVSDFKSAFDRDFGFSTTGVNATAQATTGTTGAILTVVPVDLGQGYTGTPKVTITDANDGPGQGATATANVANGQVTSYTVNTPGTGYVAPVVTVTAGGVDPTNMDYIRDTDILRALTAAGVNFNQALWGSQETFTYAFLMKAAHFLCINLKGSNQGLRGHGGDWLRAAFAVGDISASYQFPPQIMNSKILAPLMETTYGCQYLQLVAPQLVANMRAVWGHTKP